MPLSKIFSASWLNYLQVMLTGPSSSQSVSQVVWQTIPSEGTSLKHVFGAPMRVMEIWSKQEGWWKLYGRNETSAVKKSMFAKHYENKVSIYFWCEENFPGRKVGIEEILNYGLYEGRRTRT